MTKPVVVFDLGGVLVRICRTWEEACARAGIEVREINRFREPSLAARRRYFHGLHQTGQLSCKAYFAAIAEASGGLYSADEVRRIHNSWTSGDYPGVESVIQRLRTSGHRTACLSNTNHSHWVILTSGDGAGIEASRALRSLDVRLASHLMGLAKPDEAIYAAAEEALGVPASRVVFFDDLHENIDAARARGWGAHLIDHQGDTAAQIHAHLTSIGVP